MKTARLVSAVCDVSVLFVFVVVALSS